MSRATRDLAAPELWQRSLERSRRRRELAPRARRELARRKQASAAVAMALLAGPLVPLAAVVGRGGGGADAEAAGGLRLSCARARCR